jgi:YggT family protein
MDRNFEDRPERTRDDGGWRDGGPGDDPARYDADAGRGAMREPRQRRNPLDPPGQERGPVSSEDPTHPPPDDHLPPRDPRDPHVRQMEPNRVAVDGGEVHRAGVDPAELDRTDAERREGMDRRLVEEPVAEERRLEERRLRELERDRAATRSREQRSYAVGRVIMGVDYLFYLLYAVLAVRFVLALVGASRTAGFVQFINGITQPFYAPFSGIVAAPSMNGGVMDFPVLIAILAYALLHMAVRGLLRLMISPRA